MYLITDDYGTKKRMDAQRGTRLAGMRIAQRQHHQPVGPRCGHPQPDPGVLIMDNFTATGLAEGFIEAESEEQVVEAWQHLIDTGLCWTLQGFFGRTAANLIDAGICTAA